jgi:hypothetical protein
MTVASFHARLLALKDAHALRVEVNRARQREDIRIALQDENPRPLQREQIRERGARRTQADHGDIVFVRVR